MASIPLPLQDPVRDLFADLLSKGVSLDEVDDQFTLSPDVPAVIAEFVDTDGEVAGACIADLAFACRSGSALVMMPSEVAEEAVEAGELDGDMLDCFKEVVNVLSRLMNSADTPHVKLSTMYQTGQLLPGPVRTMVMSKGRRRDYTVSIEEYGEGRLSVMSRFDPEGDEMVADAA